MPSTPSASPASDTPSVPPAAPLVTHRAPVASAGLWALAVAMVLAVVAVLAVGVLWQRLLKTQEELARRTTDVQLAVNDTRTQAQRAEAAVQDMQTRLSVAEVRLSEVTLQRSQLEELMLTVSRSRDDSLVQDLESTIRLAMQQAQLTGSVTPLISALQAADQRIARAAQPRLNPVQRAMRRDIERIRSAATLDVPALVTRIDEILAAVDTWPLQNDALALHALDRGLVQTGAGGAVEQADPNPGSTADGWRHWGQWWSQTLSRWWVHTRNGVADLVRISRIDRPEAALLSPDQAFFLRENTKLVLLNARMGLLARQWAAARRDVQNAQHLLERYFDHQLPGTRLTHGVLTQLQRDMQHDQLPTPDDTLAALAVAAGGR